MGDNEIFPTNKKLIGNKVKWLRKNAVNQINNKITPEDVYSFLDISKSSYYSIERGAKELTFSQAYKICCLYSITFPELLTPTISSDKTNGL